METAPGEGGAGKPDERPGQEEREAGGCFAGSLSLRGGKAGNRCVGCTDDGMEGWSKGETLDGDSGDEGTGEGDGRSEGEETLSEESDAERRENREGRLRRTERVRDLRALDKRYDPDAESAYSRSEGGLSREDLLNGGVGGCFADRIAGSEPSGERRFSAGHLWRRRMNCWYVDVRCGGCGGEVLDEFFWACGLPVCGMEMCERCRRKWDKQRRLMTKEMWKER